MSVQIDNMLEVDGLLLGGLWIDVDLGTLRRTNSSRSSGVGGIELYWLSDGRMYVANAGEVHAVRSIIPTEPEVAEPEEEAEVPVPVPPPLERVVEDEEPDAPELDPNSMMATLKRAREARSDEDSAEESEKGAQEEE